jgi:hypothetical protein
MIALAGRHVTHTQMVATRLFYEPSALTHARQNNQGRFKLCASDVGRALRYAGGSAPARRPTPTTVTDQGAVLRVARGQFRMSFDRRVLPAALTPAHFVGRTV